MSWLDDNNNDLFYFSTDESKNDPHYRYKLEKPKKTTIIKKGTKLTFFENSELYAEKMGVPSIYVGKYIGYKFSCATDFDKDKKCIYWKGDISQNLIEKHIKDFIKLYVLCPDCDYPETNLILKPDKKNMQMICRSCGKYFDVKDIEKTYDFILKDIIEKEKEKERIEKKEKKEKKE